MKAYTLEPSGFVTVKRQIIVRTIILGTIAGSISLYVVSMRSSLAVLAVTALVGATAGSFGVFQAIRKQRQGWLSWQLLLDEESVTRKQSSLTDMEIQSAEITAVSELSDGTITIHTSRSDRAISIPTSIQDREEIRAHLNGWKEIRRLADRRWMNQVLIGIFAAVGFATVWMSETIIVVVPTGLVLIAALLWGLVTMVSSTQIDSRTKRLSWLVLLPLFSIVVKLLQVLSLI